jgi:hypothetical protein
MLNVVCSETQSPTDCQHPQRSNPCCIDALQTLDDWIQVDGKTLQIFSFDTMMIIAGTREVSCHSLPDLNSAQSTPSHCLYT